VPRRQREQDEQSEDQRGGDDALTRRAPIEPEREHEEEDRWQQREVSPEQVQGVA